MTDNADLSRRAFLRTAVGVGATAAATGAASAQQDTVTVEVGPGGNLVFKPGTEQPLEIAPGTTVKFVWKSDFHNIVVESQPEGANWEGTPGGKSKTYDTGYTYTHTFETKGTYEYFCQPHKSAGMVGTIVVTESPSTPSEGTATATPGGNETTAGAGDGGGGGGGPTKEVAVGPGGNLVFEPETIQVTPGTTVKWVWESDNHNIVVESQPEGASWKGTPGSDTKTYDTGYTYSHTFETLGSYEYFCQPHKTAGMVGTVEVVESISTPQAASVPQVPEGAKTLGVATTVAMVATLGLAFFFLKYGGDYQPPEE